MSQRPPRPRAFRLDDRRIAVDDQPAPYAPEAVIRSQHEAIPAAAPAPIDEAELEIEAAQKSGLIARSRVCLARATLPGEFCREGSFAPSKVSFGSAGGAWPVAEERLGQG